MWVRLIVFRRIINCTEERCNFLAGQGTERRHSEKEQASLGRYLCDGTRDLFSESYLF